MRLSNHSKIRMRERTELNHKERLKLFREALNKGKNAQDIKNEEIKAFIKSKENRCKIKLYKDYVYIYSKTGKTLYTMYKLPDKLVGREKYR